MGSLSPTYFLAADPLNTMLSGPFMQSADHPSTAGNRRLRKNRNRHRRHAPPGRPARPCAQAVIGNLRAPPLRSRGTGRPAMKIIIALFEPDIQKDQKSSRQPDGQAEDIQRCIAATAPQPAKNKL